MTYRLSDIDIRLLHVFRAVVECRGFTNAQSVLDVGQSTISNQMLRLETRLGFRLCERGRIGFRLTPKGKKVFEETLKIFKAHEHFQNFTAELKGTLSGFLNIAVIDNVVTDPDCPVVRALNLFNKRDHEVSIRLEVMTPGEIERAITEVDIDVAVGTFHHRMSGLDYRSIYVEKNELLCGRDHPLFSVDDANQIREIIQSSRKVTRGYLEGRDVHLLGVNWSLPNAVVQNLEATAILILAGGHIGFLPRHFAMPWKTRDEMKAILPHEIVYKSDFHIVTRRGRRKSMILKNFLADLETAVQATQGPQAAR